MIGLREKFPRKQIGPLAGSSKRAEGMVPIQERFRALSAGDSVKAALDLEYLSARVVREVVRLLNPRLVHLPLGGKG